MKPYRYLLLVTVAAAAVALASSSTRPGAASPPQAPAARNAREEAYRANNLGVALLEQFKHREGAEQFRRALSLDPKLALARTNLAIALFNVPDLAAAQKEAEGAAAASPDAPQPAYILGLIARQQNRVEDAAAAFQRVLKVDPRDVGASVNLGQLYSQQRKYAEAVALFRTALAEEPYNGTALYNLGTALLRSGAREEGQRLMQQFQALRASGAATTVGQNYLEQGRYAEAVASTGAEPDVVDKRMPEVSFNDATAAAIPSAAEAGGGPLLFDFDGDGDLDLFAAAGRKLFRNDGGKFADASAQSGLSAEGARAATLGAVAGDYDNDERPDLFIVSPAALFLYHNEGGGRFKDVTAAARIPARQNSSRAAAFVDVDHDGDLDLFVGGGAVQPESAPNVLLRNNGDGTFADVTAASKLAPPAGGAVAVVPTDYDNRRDVDLLVVGATGPPALWKNLRDGTFRDVAAEAGLNLKGSGFIAVAAGDVNKDGFTDFYFGRADGRGEFALSDGRGRFGVSPAPAGSAGEQTAAQFLDYDNDGLLDLLTISRAAPGDVLRVLRNTGDGWADVSEKASRSLLAAAAGGSLLPASLASGDLDGDGDTDLVIGSESQNRAAMLVARNDGGNRNRSLRVRLAGKVSNRSGVGAKIELRAGSLQQKLESYSASPAPAPADVVFGLGQRESADAVRILWPSGVVQAETQSAGGAEGERARRAGRAEGVGAGSQALFVPLPLRLERRAVRVRDRLHGRRRDGRPRGARRLQHARPGRVRAHPRRPVEAEGRALRAARDERAGRGALRRPPATRGGRAPRRAGGLSGRRAPRRAAGVQALRVKRRAPARRRDRRARARRAGAPDKARPPLPGRLQGRPHPRLRRAPHADARPGRRRGEGGAGRRGDRETGRGRDGETGRQGDGDARRGHTSPRPPVP